MPMCSAWRTDRLVDRVDGMAHVLDSPGIEPLAVISGFLEEDFILLQQVDGQDQITAASNAYSSSGRIVSSVAGGAFPGLINSCRRQ